QSSLSLSLVQWRGDLALGANFQSQISLGRSYKMAVRAGLNNKLSGQINVRTSDLALGANFQSQISLGRSYKMAVRAGLNNKLSGQINVRTSSSDQLQISLIAILPVAKAIYKNFWPGVNENYSIY
ncbi:hypothetical protein KIW84_032785, partial [Lathyrus oleraceus]